MYKVDCNKIDALVKEIQLISKNRYNRKFFINPEDELKHLKEALNQMLESMVVYTNQSHASLEQLRISNKELEKAYEIIEKSAVFVFEWTLTPEAPTKFVTNNISRFGYTPEDFYNGELKDYWDFVYEEDIEKTMLAVYNARQQNIDEFNHTYRVVCKNKEIRWVEEWLILERDESGTPIAEKGILRDITEQKKLADKLKESEERYRNLYENAAAIIFTYDLEGRLTSVNNVCSQILCYPQEEILGMHFADFIISNNKNHIYGLDIITYTLQNFQKPIELKVLNKKNQVIVLETYISLIYKDGAPYEIQGVAQDITARKKAEEKIIHMSYHDKLTGLYNRTYYDERLKKLDNRGAYPYTIIIGDMNGLKLANDAFGHKIGDDLLKKMARILVKACRKDDIIARIGGDEFSIILPETTEVGAKRICDRIRKLCLQTEANPIQLSIALGYSTKRSNKITNELLIKEADDRMYKNKLNESKSIRSSIIASLQTTLDEKTMETREHAERLKALSLMLGKSIGLSDSQLDELSLASIMHDIGKIAIPDSILSKSGKLTEKEWEVMKKHTEIGYHIMMSSANMRSIGEYILAHHERWDGKGYPRGLKGEEIPIISRIITITDAYDVMTHPRSYSPAKSHAEALEEIRRCAGTQFDPLLAERFIALMMK
ncbi:HD domain-containing phosphohydrolase [Alkaliphilus peptidifermentans]|uniref:PAS domain S-box-containing protein/diguanylate cyclase (GGDEF) domain-containing protein n=1 Tax=Alkaliphilus peptidifermentans DSM 18978 TaxID=1120976 RepID=A0A1G5EZU2_9FIRM|nr:HD domain-containing phosphohydrolase [Alkaliphilus peptidifermentans]SCY32487.1 PAS domain S-box-containing protein/diguanylate cyclase (GGDEF) domain-containing protein [Alkaliphilus peptidifermentans DSM 18978]